MLAPPAVPFADVVEDTVENEPEPARATGRDQAIERRLAAEPRIDRVVVGGVVFVRRRRGEDRRQVHGVGAERRDVIELPRDAVEPSERPDEELIDYSCHGALFNMRGAKNRAGRQLDGTVRTFVPSVLLFYLR
jgi:hypothetical protein